MSSSVFFKFKSQKEQSKVEFDGTGISVFELKRDIIIKSNLGDGSDFDLVIYNQDDDEPYDDDTTIIPRSTSVIARRLPPIKPGAGRAARYMSGKMPVNMKNSSRKEQGNKQKAGGPSAVTQINDSMTEEQKMAAMFQMQGESWTVQQEEMSNQTPVFRPGAKKGMPAANVPDHEPPTGYICYRCGEKGHWIQVCPTNDDPTFDNKPRVKRTTGIPRSFLKTVAKPSAMDNDGTVDDSKPSGVMVNAEGEYVIAEPDKASWKKYQDQTKSSAAQAKAAALDDKEAQDRGLECSIDKRIFVEPMKTPCCGKTYCNDCIVDALITSDFTCPGCQKDPVLIDDLKSDDDMTQKIIAYLDEKNATREERKRSRSPEEAAGNQARSDTPLAQVKTEKSPSPNKSPSALTVVPAKESPKESQQKSPSPGAKEETIKSKKRPADELLENPKIPKGPKAMQQQQAQKEAMLAQQKLQQQQAMLGFPAMPMNMNMYNGGGYGGFGSMPMGGFNTGFNPMMNPMMMNQFGGFPMATGMNMYGGGGFAGGMAMNGMGRGGMNGVGAGMGGGLGFQGQQPVISEEDNAYFRQPVNPHRHVGRARNKPRPADYREM